MNSSFLTAVLMLTCLLGVGVSARAQDVDAVVVRVPFEFVAGGTTLPAGEYKVFRVNPRELAIGGYGKGNALLLPAGFDDTPFDQPMLSFTRVGGKYFLTKIKTLSRVYTMPASRDMVMLGKSSSQGTMSAAGTN